MLLLLELYKKPLLVVIMPFIPSHELTRTSHLDIYSKITDTADQLYKNELNHSKLWDALELRLKGQLNDVLIVSGLTLWHNHGTYCVGSAIK